MKTTWAEYSIDVPAAGTYGMTMMIAVANRDQKLDISSGGQALATIKLPSAEGLWRMTDEVSFKLDKGVQTLRITSGAMQRGIAIRWFELKAK
jgi:hypothetical protein